MQRDDQPCQYVGCRVHPSVVRPLRRTLVDSERWQIAEDVDEDGWTWRFVKKFYRISDQQLRSALSLRRRAQGVANG